MCIYFYLSKDVSLRISETSDGTKYMTGYSIYLPVNSIFKDAYVSLVVSAEFFADITAFAMEIGQHSKVTTFAITW